MYLQINFNEFFSKNFIFDNVKVTKNNVFLENKVLEKTDRLTLLHFY